MIFDETESPDFKLYSIGELFPVFKDFPTSFMDLSMLTKSSYQIRSSELPTASNNPAQG
jgi:hypothetical protein